jgi:hypothetical protein
LIQKDLQGKLYHTDTDMQSQTQTQTQTPREKFIRQLEFNLSIYNVTITPVQRQMLLAVKKDRMEEVIKEICRTNNIVLC